MPAAAPTMTLNVSDLDWVTVGPHHDCGSVGSAGPQKLAINGNLC